MSQAANAVVKRTIDIRQVNAAIKDTHLPVPPVYDIQCGLQGKKFFSKLDLRSAFHQQFRHVNIFHAGNHLMQYKQMTMGTKPDQVS